MPVQLLAQFVVVIFYLAIAGCACPAAIAGNRSKSRSGTQVKEASAQHLPQVQFVEDNRREIDELINEATVGPSIARRSAAALAAADQATAGLAEVLNAIESARRVVLSNVQNAETTGYKATQSGIDGHKAICHLDLTQGELVQTNTPLDLAIQGNGFFPIKLVSGFGDGIGYARAGNFYINAKNEMILGLREGYRLVPPITIPRGSTHILIGNDGTIQGTPPGSATPRTIGTLQLAGFVNPQGMEVLDGNVFLASDASGPPMTATAGTNGLGLIEQGFLESSNVDLVQERLRLRFLNQWQNAIEQALANRQ